MTENNNLVTSTQGIIKEALHNWDLTTECTILLKNH